MFDTEAFDGITKPTGVAFMWIIIVRSINQSIIVILSFAVKIDPLHINWVPMQLSLDKTNYNLNIMYIIYSGMLSSEADILYTTVDGHGIELWSVIQKRTSSSRYGYNVYTNQSV